MAFVQAPIPQEQQNQFGLGGQTTSNPLGMVPPQATQTGGSSGQGAGGTGSAPGMGTPTQFGTAASRLSDYLNANANQTQTMANNIAGTFNQNYGQAQGQIQNLGSQFQGDVSKGYAAPNQNLVDIASAFPDWFVKGGDQNVKAFQAQLNDAYTGPQNFESYQPYADVQKNVQDALQQSNLVQTYPGLSSYLSNNTTGQYTPGMNTLDTTLLQAYQPAYQTITSAANQFQNLPGQLSDTAKAGNESVQAAQKAAPQAAQYASNALTGAASNLGQTLQDQLASSQQAFSTYNTDVGKLRGAAQDINAAVQDYLAKNPQITISGNTDFLAPWANLQEATLAPTVANVASAQDYANLAALQKLAGNTLQIQSPLDQSQAGEAGKFGLPQDLQAALLNGAVPEAMRNELTAISGQITGAYDPFAKAMQAGSTAYQSYLAENAKLSDLQSQLRQTPAEITDADTGAAIANPKYADLQNQIAAVTQQRLTDQQASDAAASTQRGLAPNLQWLTGASTGYNDLIARLQADMQGLGGMNIPNFVARAPSAAPKQAANGLAMPTGAVTAGASMLPNVGAMSGAGIAGGSPAILDAAGMSPLEAAGPAAAAAYGTSNLVQNAIANPGQTAQNMGNNFLTAMGAETLPPALYNDISQGMQYVPGPITMAENFASNPVQNSLAALVNLPGTLTSLAIPQNVLSSIGSGINNVINSIGNFFGGLF